jgi:hypothetical protein
MSFFHGKFMADQAILRSEGAFVKEEDQKSPACFVVHKSMLCRFFRNYLQLFTILRNFAQISIIARIFVQEFNFLPSQNFTVWPSSMTQGLFWKVLRRRLAQQGNWCHVLSLSV